MASYYLSDFDFDTDKAAADKDKTLNERLQFLKGRLNTAKEFVKNDEFGYYEMKLQEYFNKMKNEIELVELIIREVIITDELSKYSKPKISQKKKEKISYQWKGDAKKELPKLFNKMKGNWIANETTLKQFRAIFTGLPIKKIEPVKWHNDIASEVLYFSEKLTLDKRVNKVAHLHIRLKSCFVRSDGTAFAEHFKELNQTIHIMLAEQTRNAIDKLIADL